MVVIFLYLFADLIPAEGEDLHWGRARQALIPDLRLQIPTPNGPTDSLAELKCISAGVTWYPRGVKGKGTDRRAAKLPAEYKRNLRKLDHRFHNTTRDQAGPLVQRLLSYGDLRGLVVGPWVDGSRDLHSLIKLLGEQRVLAQARARGRPASDRDLGIITGQIRRVLSTSFIRAQAICIIARTSFLGKGGMAAGERRTLMMRKEDAYRKEQEAHY